MNRRTFIKAIGAGLATLAIPLQWALRRPRCIVVREGETLVFEDEDYDTITVDGGTLVMGGGTGRVREIVVRAGVVMSKWAGTVTSCDVLSIPSDSTARIGHRV